MQLLQVMQRFARAWRNAGINSPRYFGSSVSMVSPRKTRNVRGLLAAAALCALALPVSPVMAQTSTSASSAGWFGGGAPTQPSGTVPLSALGGSNMSFGQQLSSENVGTDYGALTNAAFARFTPVFVLCGIFAVIIAASKGGLKMVLGTIGKRLKGGA